MRKSDCLFERASHWGVGAALLLMALGLSIIGITVLPVLGLLLALPVFFLSASFFLAPSSQECLV
jgi:hypothetical protein